MMHDRTTPAAPADLSSRRGLLGTAVLGGLAAAPMLGLWSSPAQATQNPQQKLDASAKEALDDIRKHEIDHRNFLLKTLGSKARPKPTFKNIKTSSFSQFIQMARTAENVESGGYLGLLPAFSSNTLRQQAASINLIEARHAGFLNVFTGVDITRQAKTGTYASFEQPLTVSEVAKFLSQFIASLNGGPPLTVTPGDDTSILNFALVSEYLGAEFYSLNVPKYV